MKYLLPALICAVVFFAACLNNRVYAQTQPDIVLVIVDDFDASMIQHLPELYAGGLVFENFIFSQSLCCPSRATMLSGRFPWNTGVKGNTAPTGGASAFRPHEASAIGPLMQQRGYRTGYFGKYLNEYSSYRVPVGWDRWYANTGKVRYKRADMNLDGDPFTMRGYITDWLSEQASLFLGDPDGRPSFAIISPPAPHKPNVPAARHKKVDFPAAPQDDFYQRRLRTMLAVQEMLERLRAEHPEAIVFLVSDNGYHYKADFSNGSKSHPAPTDSDVPAVVWGPDIQPRHVLPLVGHADLLPTFTELGGGVVLRDGASLVPYLRGESPILRRFIPLWNKDWGWGIRSEVATINDDPREVWMEDGTAPLGPDLVKLHLDALEQLKHCAGPACLGRNLSKEKDLVSHARSDSHVRAGDRPERQLHSGLRPSRRR